MKKIKAGQLLIAVSLISIFFCCGCRTYPTKAGTYRAVDGYFHLGTRPYSIMFGSAWRWGEVRIWPVKVIPLDFQDEFEMKYPDEHFLYLNESGDWEIANLSEMKTAVMMR